MIAIFSRHIWFLVRCRSICLWFPTDLILRHPNAECKVTLVLSHIARTEIRETLYDWNARSTTYGIWWISDKSPSLPHIVVTPHHHHYTHIQSAAHTKTKLSWLYFVWWFACKYYYMRAKFYGMWHRHVTWQRMSMKAEGCSSQKFAWTYYNNIYIYVWKMWSCTYAIKQLPTLPLQTKPNPTQPLARQIISELSKCSYLKRFFDHIVVVWLQIILRCFGRRRIIHFPPHFSNIHTFNEDNTQVKRHRTR